MLFKIGNRGKFASKGLLGLRICRPIRLLQQWGVLEVLVLAERARESSGSYGGRSTGGNNGNSRQAGSGDIAGVSGFGRGSGF